MQLKEIVELAAVLLGLQTTLDCGAFALTAEESQIKQIIDANDDLKLLVRCANLVYKEVACDYLPLSTSETVFTEDGTVEYGSLSRQLLEVESITDEKGSKIKFNCFASCLSTSKGKVTITYNYVPRSAEFFDTLDYSNNKISDRILAYGTAAEFCLISGQGQDAVVWDKRYKDALVIACRKRGEIRMPARVLR